MRNDKWLEKELKRIWQKHFPDLEKKNEVVIHFGRRARTRLGSIKEIRDKRSVIRNLKNKNLSLIPDSLSLIIINGLFQDEKIPEFVVTATISHELTHYTHGFSSPHNKTHEHPHYGGVVRKEMIDRGLEDEHYLSKKWIKENWKDYLLKYYPPLPKRRRRRKRVIYIFR